MKPPMLLAVPARLGLLSLLVALALAMSGCAQQSLPALQDARASYDQAAADRTVQEYAPVALYEAEQALREAEEEWEDDEDEDEARHMSYIVQKRVEIARARAQAGQAEQSGSQLQEQLEDLAARQTQRGMVITFNSEVLFEVDESTVKPGARQQLDRLANVLQDYPDRRVIVEGHTDDTGPAQYNEELSMRRAQAVEAQLARSGLDPGRIEVRAFGETQPVAPNTTVAGRQENRRVDIVIPRDGGMARGG